MVPPSMRGTPPPPAEDAEDRALLDDPQITPEGELEPPRHGVPRDCGDDRLGEDHPGGAQRRVPLLVHPVAGLGAGEGFQVRPGAEGPPCPPEDGHPGLRIRLEGPEGVGQRLGSGAIHGVFHFGAIDDDGGDRPVHFTTNVHDDSSPVQRFCGPRSIRETSWNGKNTEG